MFGDTLYRYPKLFVFFCAVKTLWLPCVLQGVITVRWIIPAPDYPLVLISAIPCLIVVLTAGNILVYNRLYDIACDDVQVKQALDQHPRINKEDYLLWATMEAYKLYQNEHKDDSDSHSEICRRISLVLIMFQLIFMPVLV